MIHVIWCTSLPYSYTLCEFIFFCFCARWDKTKDIFLYAQPKEDAFTYISIYCCSSAANIILYVEGLKWAGLNHLSCYSTEQLPTTSHIHIQSSIISSLIWSKRSEQKHNWITKIRLTHILSIPAVTLVGTSYFDSGLCAFRAFVALIIYGLERHVHVVEWSSRSNGSQIDFYVRALLLMSLMNERSVSLLNIWLWHNRVGIIEFI